MTIAVIYITETIYGTCKVGRLSLLLVLVLIFAVTEHLMNSCMLILRSTMVSGTILVLRILAFIYFTILLLRMPGQRLQIAYRLKRLLPERVTNRKLVTLFVKS